MAQQATLKEAMDGRKKKSAKKARRKHGKEMEIARQVQAGENRSDMEAKIESEDPTKVGGDASSSRMETKTSSRPCRSIMSL